MPRHGDKSIQWPQNIRKRAFDVVRLVVSVETTLRRRSNEGRPARRPRHWAAGPLKTLPLATAGTRGRRPRALCRRRPHMRPPMTTASAKRWRASLASATYERPSHRLLGDDVSFTSRRGKLCCHLPVHQRCKLGRCQPWRRNVDHPQGRRRFECAPANRRGDDHGERRLRDRTSRSSAETEARCGPPVTTRRTS